MQRSSVLFPEPLGADHADDLAAIDLEADAAQDLELAEALVDLLDLQHLAAIRSRCDHPSLDSAVISGGGHASGRSGPRSCAAG